MEYSRQEHWRFLEEELRSQTDSFKQKLDTKASYLLLEREELFIAQFVKIEKGEMILKFSNNRGIPRKGEYLYCFTTPKKLHNYKEWDNLTYGNLIKSKGFATELVCVWQSVCRDDVRYCLVGFRGVDIDFAEHVAGHQGAFLILGPNMPPFQYIKNIQRIVRDAVSPQINNLLDGSCSVGSNVPLLIPKHCKISEYILAQLTLSDSVILQGPPGTGKTYQIANICKKLCNQGKSVLITALTNRALIEVAKKEELRDLLVSGKIHKTKLTIDEVNELPELCSLNNLTVEPGHIVLSTFYTASGEVDIFSEKAIFDFVIMDEASQALLGMFMVCKLLGRKSLFVGDVNQLSPIVLINEDRIHRQNYYVYVDGLVSFERIELVPTYRLVETYKLPQRAACYTGMFYDDMLLSKQVQKSFSWNDLTLDSQLKISLPIGGGPILIKINLPLGQKKPIPAAVLVVKLISAILKQQKKLHISVLSFYVETTKLLQKVISQVIKDNVVVETVSRIQGLTTDIAIYVVPNTIYTYSLNRRLFNVATSRSRSYTFIITDVDILDNRFIDKDVRRFLEELDKSSFYFPIKLEDQNILDIE